MPLTLKNFYRSPQELCFTANTAGSTIKLNKIWSPLTISLETSIDANNWTVYTIWSTITLSNVWDKIYMRNTSETPVDWGGNGSYYYQFVISWSVAASWDINYLLCKNSTNTTIAYCYINLFNWCTGLTSAPKLPATEAKEGCYRSMFFWCTGLTEAPELPFTSVERICCYDMFNWCTNLTSIPLLKPTSFVFQCCRNMFSWCSKIKLSTTQTWEYQTEYRIPTTWTWSMSGDALYNMFGSTWWTFTWTPTINTTYYTSNTLV